MRILTWNMAGGDKRPAVASLNADIGVFQELARNSRSPQCHWLCEPAPRILGIDATANYTVERIETHARFRRHFIPVQIDGPERFQLIAVWAKDDGPEKYVRRIIRAVERWSRPIAAQPTVILGDFNASAIWDHHHPEDRNFSSLVKRLDKLGLVSAYHTFFGEAPGSETRPTFHQYRHATRPYHMDYIFLPKVWLPRLRGVEVGKHAEWAQWSDHMPLTVDLE